MDKYYETKNRITDGIRFTKEIFRISSPSAVQQQVTKGFEDYLKDEMAKDRTARIKIFGNSKMIQLC